MDFAFSEEQEMLRSSTRDFLVKECSSKVVRKLMDAPGAYDEGLWRKIAGLGWTALGIPEQYGGVGTFLDLIVVLEEAGRALMPGPFFATMGLAVPALIEAGTEDQKKEVLGAIAQGSARATLALTEPSGRWDAAAVTLSAKPSGGSWKLDGVKLFVPDADMTRRWSEVRFDGVKLEGDSLMGPADKAWPHLKRALEWGTAALCAEMVGGTQKVLETSTEYAKTRHQFGKPIGIYQAVSHKLADMLVLSESGRSATYYAAWTVDADAADRSLAASMAKAYVSDAYRKVAGDGIQVHGGIGFTWEHDMHLYFKRAKSSEVTLGDATYHRELVAQALEL